MGKKLCGSVAIVLISAILCSILLFTGNITVACGETALEIRASYWKDLTVSYEEIESLSYAENWEHGVRFSGYGSAKLHMGTFENDTVGHYTLYAYAKTPSAVIIESQGRVLAICTETAESTYQLYETLKEAIQ
jgi:hypothetical protein